MNEPGEATAVELAALRKQVEALSQRVEELMEALRGSVAPTPASAAPPPPRGGDDIPWLVIAAAVATVIKEPHRISSLQLSEFPPVNLWSIEGRRAVFHSHRVR